MKFAAYWQAFLHWPGWQKFGQACVSGWKKTIQWAGWHTIFFLPMSVAAIVCVFCGAGLIWVFACGRDQTIPAYALYALSAYALTTLCMKLPSGIQNVRAWLQRHPRLTGFLSDKDLKFTLGLYFDQLLNFSYGMFKVASGVIFGSAWIGCDGIYNLAQAGIQLFQILRRKKPGTLVHQWKSYRFCGVLVLLMHLTLTGIVFQMLNWNRADEQETIMIIATAIFAFYKFISSFIDIAKDRKHTHPIDSSVRMLELSQAIFAIFSLQASLLHAFGTGESWEHWLNTIVGCTVCLLIVAMGVYMIRRGNREIRKEQEKEHG